MQNLYITSNNPIIQISLNSWQIIYCFAESSVIRSVAVLNRTAMHQTINQINHFRLRKKYCLRERFRQHLKDIVIAV